MCSSDLYIPSGRGIQALDYSHRNPDGSVARVPDSLTNLYYTKNGREVRDGGGVTPDISLTHEQGGTIAYYLMAENIIFDYATGWVQNNDTIAPPEQFVLPDEDYQGFVNFVKSKDFEYDKMSENSLNQLKSIMEFEGYMDTSVEEFTALEKKLQPDLDRDLNLFKELIKKMIETEIVQRYYYKKGVLKHQLANDIVFDKAIEILKNTEDYNAIILPQKDSNLSRK